MIGSERIERFELQEEMYRWFFNFHHHFYDDDCNGEISMIVRMKEDFFQLECKKEKQCLLRRQSLLLNEKSSYSPHPAQDLAFIQGTCSRYLSNSLAMMGVINHDDVGNDDASNDATVMMMMMNTNGND